MTKISSTWQHVRFSACNPGDTTEETGNIFLIYCNKLNNGVGIYIKNIITKYTNPGKYYFNQNLSLLKTQNRIIKYKPWMILL